MPDSRAAALHCENANGKALPASASAARESLRRSARGCFLLLWSLCTSLGSRAARALHDLALHRQLRSGQLERALRSRRLDAFDLEHDAARLYHGDPHFRVTLTLAHAGLGRLLGYRLVREDADPNLAAALDVARERDTSSFDLTVRDPARLCRLQSKVAERHGVTASRHAARAALL